MQNPTHHTLKTTIALFALGTCLTACGRGFQAPGVLQTQSGTADTGKKLPDTSLKQIQSNDDPVTQKEDPILASTPNKNTAYKLPESTFETIRVRLLPITSSFLHDAYEDSQKVDTVSLANENGLVIKDLATTTKAFLARGKVIRFVFSKKQMTIDGKVSTFDPKSLIGIFPHLAGSLTQVSLRLNDSVIKGARLTVVKPGELPFRGLFLLRAIGTSASWSLINYVALEDYVRAVVPSEIGASSPPEAIKAQALAARTFALHNMGVARCVGYGASPTPSRCSPRAWDVDPSTAYQCFLGGLAENQSIFASIDASNGMILGFKGAPILAMYHASSGGQTASAAQYFCKSQKSPASKAGCETRAAAAYPYLAGKVDPFNGAYKRAGPGVGLPQRSAQEMAKQKHSVNEIIAQYYPGSLIEKIDRNR